MAFDPTLLEWDETETKGGFDPSLIEWDEPKKAEDEGPIEIVAGTPKKPTPIPATWIQGPLDVPARSPEELAAKSFYMAKGVPPLEPTSFATEQELEKTFEKEPLGTGASFMRGLTRPTAMTALGGPGVLLAPEETKKDILLKEYNRMVREGKQSGIAKAAEFAGGIPGTLVPLGIAARGGRPGIMASMGSMGAGEAYIAAGVKAMAEGKDVDEANRIGNIAAGVGAVAQAGVGAAFPTGAPSTMGQALKTGGITGTTAAAARLAENIAQRQAGLQTPLTEGMAETGLMMGLLPPAARVLGAGLSKLIPRRMEPPPIPPEAAAEEVMAVKPAITAPPPMVSTGVPDIAPLEAVPSRLEMQVAPRPVEARGGIPPTPEMLKLLPEPVQEKLSVNDLLRGPVERGEALAKVEELGQQIRRRADFEAARAEQLKQNMAEYEASLLHPDKPLTDNQLRLVEDSLRKAILENQVPGERKGFVAGTRVEKWAKEWSEGFRERALGRASMNPVDQIGNFGKDVASIAVQIAAMMERGVMRMADISKELIAKYGPDITPLINKAYDHALQLRPQWTNVESGLKELSSVMAQGTRDQSRANKLGASMAEAGGQAAINAIEGKVVQAKFNLDQAKARKAPYGELNKLLAAKQFAEETLQGAKPSERSLVSEVLEKPTEAEPSKPGLLPSGETIVATAIRTPDGKILSGKNKIHPQLWGEAGIDMGSLTSKQIREDNGFLTDSGRFVTSREAEQSSAARTFQESAKPAAGAPEVEKTFMSAERENMAKPFTFKTWEEYDKWISEKPDEFILRTLREQSENEIARIREEMLGERPPLDQNSQRMSRINVASVYKEAIRRGLNISKSEVLDKYIGTTPSPQAPGIVAGTPTEEWANQVLSRSRSLGIKPVGGSELMAAYAVKAAAVIERGAPRYSEFVKNMVKELGDDVKPHLPALYAQAQQQLFRQKPTALTAPPVTKPAEPPQKLTMAGAQPPPIPEAVKPYAPISAEFPTGIKNATVDQERAALGLPPAMEPASKEFGRSWNEAMAIAEQQPSKQNLLIAELSKKPRPVTDTENALLTHRQVELKNEYNKAAKALNQAYDEGNTAAIADEQLRVDYLSDELLKLFNINKAVGTEAARGFNIRKMMANEDFTLAAMETRKRAARGGKPLTNDERAELQRLQEQIADNQKAFEDQVERSQRKKAASGKPYDVSQDKEAIRLKAEYERWKRKFERGLDEDRLKRRTSTEKALDTLKEITGLPRKIWTAYDLSAVFRQGAPIVLGHPVRGAKAFKPMIDAMRSEKLAWEEQTRILNRPNARNGLYDRADLFLSPLDDIRLNAQEEQIQSRIGDWIPGVRASNRAFTTFLNRIRADTFDSMVAAWTRKGRIMPDSEAKAIANMVNVFTGRGYLGSHAKAAETMAAFFFAPRFVTSRFQMLVGQPLYRGSARTKALVAWEYARGLIGLGAVYGLAKLAGADIETDWRSTDFGKIRIGDTRIDPLAGLSQATVLAGRIITGKKMTARGEIVPIRGPDVPYRGSTVPSVTGTFLRTKLSPLLGMGLDLLTGENVVGEKVTLKSTLLNLPVPLSFRDIYDVMMDNGVPAGTAITLLSILGMGVQNYEDRQRRTVER